jgi:hypothetical protein
LVGEFIEPVVFTLPTSQPIPLSGFENLTGLLLPDPLFLPSKLRAISTSSITASIWLVGEFIEPVVFTLQTESSYNFTYEKQSSLSVVFTLQTESSYNFDC